MRVALLLMMLTGVTGWVDPLELVLELASVAEVVTARLLDGDPCGALQAVA